MQSNNEASAARLTVGVSDVKVIEDEAFIRVTANPIAKLDRSNHVLLLSREAQSKQRVILPSEGN